MNLRAKLVALLLLFAHSAAALERPKQAIRGHANDHEAKTGDKFSELIEQLSERASAMYTQLAHADDADGLHRALGESKETLTTIIARLLQEGGDNSVTGDTFLTTFLLIGVFIFLGFIFDWVLF